MAEFNTFIKLHRSVLESSVFRDAEVLRLWIYILCKASIDDREILFNGKVVSLKAGQLIVGRKNLALSIGTTESKVYRSLKLLEELRCVSIEVNNKFSLVTVENWAKFQGVPQKMNSKTTAKQQQSNSKTTAKQQQSNTIKELNNYKNYKKERRKEDSLDRSSEKKLRFLQGELGGGIVLLSEEQEDALLDMLSVEEFDKYVSIVRDCELAGKHFKKPHYQAILEMVNEDRGM